MLESLESRQLLTVVVADASSQLVGVYDHLTGARVNSVATPSGSYECSNTLSFIACDGMAFGDVNGDGADEIIQGKNQTGRIESFDVSQLPPLVSSFNNASWGCEGFIDCDDLATGDLDGDGLDDMIWGVSQGANSGNIEIQLSSGARHTLAVGYTNHDDLAIGDLNGDAVDEIIYGNAANRTMDIFDLNGAPVRGTVSSFPGFILGNPHNYNRWDRLAAGDVNGDGKDEIIRGEGFSDDTNLVTSPEDIIIYNGQGTNLGSFQAPAFACRAGDSRLCDGLAVGDVTGNGVAEIVFGDDASGVIDVFANDPTTAGIGFQKLTSFTPIGGYRSEDQLLVPSQGDRDGDGLLDVWETNGLDINNDGTIDLDLPSFGADPDRKDIFIEVDAMAGRAPNAITVSPPAVVAAGLSTNTVLDDVVQAFLDAPVPNPDGSFGINLHLELDSLDLSLQPFPNGFDDFERFKARNFGNTAQQSHSNSNAILQAKRSVYRYAAFADSYNGGSSSGLAEIAGNEFMVTLGKWSPPGGTDDQQAGTFMHELGHNLGLTHGGGHVDEDSNFRLVSRNHKPNYKSVMNYNWQIPNGVTANSWELNYSNGNYNDLNERALDEATGIGGTTGNLVRVDGDVVPESGPVDWSCVALAGCQVSNPADSDNFDGVGSAEDDFPVSADLDGNGNLETLRDHNDWANLVYNFRDFSSFQDGVRDSVEMNEFRFEDLTAGIHGSKYEDLNANGQRDAEEPGLPGWTIVVSGIDHEGNVFNDERITMENGEYWFLDLAPGSYTVFEVQQEGWRQSAPQSEFYEVHIEPGQPVTEIDFGNYRLAQVSGLSYQDYNGDGVRDPAFETPLSDSLVVLSGVDGQGRYVSLQTQTNEDGTYSFDDVTPGTYTITEDVSSPGSLSARVAGSQDPAIVQTGFALNGDFRISDNAIPQIGDGVSEQTAWDFDFTAHPNFGTFDYGGPLASAKLVLTVMPMDASVADDLITFPQAPHIAVAASEFQTATLYTPTTITIDLLDYMPASDLLPQIGAGELGKLAMAYMSDAIISYADLTLTPLAEHGARVRSQPNSGYPMTAFSGGAYGGFDFGSRDSLFEIDLGALQQGRQSASTILTEREVILYRIEVPQPVVAAKGGHLVIDTFDSVLSDTGTGENDTELALYNEDGELMATNDDASDTARTSRLVFGDQNGSLGDLVSGTYYVAFGAYDTTFGPDRFQMHSLAASFGTPNVRFQYSTPVDLGVLTDGAFSVSSQIQQGQQPEYRFEIPSGVDADIEESLVIDTFGSQIPGSFPGNNNTELAIYDSNGQLVATNDDAPDGGFESVLEFGRTANSAGNLLPGVYYLTVAIHDAEFGPTRLDRSTGSPVAGTIQFNVDYRNELVALGLPGDIDGDNEVGFTDFLILSQAFGTSVDPPGTGADLDGDGEVGFTDFLILANNFGRKLELSI